MSPELPRTVSRRWRRIPAARREAILGGIERVLASCDVQTRRQADPVGVVRRYRRRDDRELMGVLAACIAFGNVTSIINTLGVISARLGKAPSATVDDEAALHVKLADVRHRLYRGEDLSRLLIGVRRIQRERGSLGDHFADCLEREGNLRLALAQMVAAVRSAGGLGGDTTGRAGPRHLLSDPTKASTCKRLLLYLRWMVRPDDGVDLGLWRRVPPAVLLMPVDTHIFKIAHNLGFTARKTAGWQVAEEITAVLAELDPTDPVKYDFPLCHLGMVQRCPSRRDPVRCAGCGIQGVCRHWSRG